MRSITIIIIMLTMAGCSTVSPTCNVPRASGNDSTTIVIYRPSAFVGILYVTPMSINHCRVESLSNNSYVVYKLPPGTHRVAVEKRTAELGSGEHIEQLFEAGRTYYLRQNVSFVAGIEIVSKEKALSEMLKLQSLPGI